MITLMVHIQNKYSEREERGAAMAEYGLLLAFVALAAMGVLLTLGSSIRSTFGFANEAFDKSPALSSSN